MSAIGGAAAAHLVQHAESNLNREAASADQRALNASMYRGTVFGYGTGTAQSQAIHLATVRAQQLRMELARRRRQVRRGAAGEATGDGNTDEPGGIEAPDDEVDAAANDRRDAAHESQGRRGQAPARHAAAPGKHKRRDVDKAEREGDDGDECETAADDDTNPLQAEQEGGESGGDEDDDDNGEDSGAGGGGSGRGGGKRDGRRTVRASLLRNSGGTVLPNAFVKATKNALNSIAVKVGTAITPEPSGAGPIERLAATLARDLLRDGKLHEAHFQKQWSLRERMLASPDTNYAAEHHAIELDWQRTLLKYGPVKPESAAELRDRIVGAQRRGGDRPKHDPARSQRSESVNLLLLLMLFNGQAPLGPARRKMAIDTRTAQGRMSRLGQLLVKKPAR